MRKTKSKSTVAPTTEFEVINSSGTLRMANYREAETRADFYEYVADFWSRSPKDLAHAMAECPPLAWVVHDIYLECREEVEAEFEDVILEGDIERGLMLNARLRDLPEEPEDGASRWVESLTPEDFQDRFIARITNWFSEPPNWGWEDDYLPEGGTAQGAALAFFRAMRPKHRDVLGVAIIEGDRPGSTYYAAELRYNIDSANRAAERAGIRVRFSNASD